MMGNSGMSGGMKKAANCAEGRPITLSTVEVANAESLSLGGHEAPVFVLAGDVTSSILINGEALAVSSNEPVIVRTNGWGISGGTVTLTLHCDRITLDGTEVGDA